MRLKSVVSYDGACEGMIAERKPDLRGLAALSFPSRYVLHATKLPMSNWKHLGVYTPEWVGLPSDAGLVRWNGKFRVTAICELTAMLFQMKEPERTTVRSGAVVSYSALIVQAPRMIISSNALLQRRTRTGASF